MKHTVRGREPIGDDATNVSIKVRDIVVAVTPSVSASQVHDSGGLSAITGWMLGVSKVESTQLCLGLH